MDDNERGNGVDFWAGMAYIMPRAIAFWVIVLIFLGVIAWLLINFPI